MDRVREIFEAIAGLPAERRAAEIARLCGGDASLERQVLRLVELDERASREEFLGGQALAHVAAPESSPHQDETERGERFGAPQDLPTPDSIGPYRILGVLGEGGFGVVYAAERREPLRQRVALKVIKPGMDSRAVIARFEQERQALAVMSHPNIARVLDAGVTEAAQGSRPYFVMEHVAGEPITEYCDRHNLTLRARLELFVRVCDAVQHAHHKGIIHRDIKPSNILVGDHEGGAVPKVIDFGIAKATAKMLTEMTVFTEAGQLIGTPEYMSPEQAQIGAVDIDTRTDVYPLGAVLYELLAGAVPFDPVTLRRAALFEIQRIIREEEPPKPSTRLTSLGAEDAAKVAKHRRLEREQLAGELRRELDWIPLKALRKERGERYATPKDLADDIGNYLAGRPLEAGPVSAGYRVRKFVRRNRGPVVAGSVVAFALLAGMAGLGVGLWRATESEARARSAAVREAERAAEAQEARRAEQSRASELEAVASFQGEVLAQVDPTLAGSQLYSDVMSRLSLVLSESGVSEAERTERLDRFSAEWVAINPTDTAIRLVESAILEPALEAVDQRFEDSPLIAARLQEVLADRFASLGRFERAIEVQRHVVEARMTEQGSENTSTINSRTNLADLLVSLGRFEEAADILRVELARLQSTVGSNHVMTFRVHNLLGLLHRRRNELDLAAEHYRQALDGRRRLLGEEHPDTLQSMSNMGVLLWSMGRLDEAEPYYVKAYEARLRTLGSEHFDTLISLRNLGGLRVDQGRLEEAEGLFAQALETSTRIQGSEHPQTLACLRDMTFVLTDLGRINDALQYGKDALARSRVALGNTHGTTLLIMSDLGYIYQSSDRLIEAEGLYAEALEGSIEAHGREHPNTLQCVLNLATVLSATERDAEAATLLAEFEAEARVGFAVQPRRLVGILFRFAEALLRQDPDADRLAKAEELLVQISAIVDEEGLNNTVRQRMASAFVALYEAWQTVDPSADHGDSALEWRLRLERTPEP